MLHDMYKIFDKMIEKAKKKVYGKTFFCPVCHIELSFHDRNEDGLLVCPVCGVVIELTDVFGHPLPVVHDVEIYRVQPKLRLHPAATHLPIGLMPFALLGGGFLFMVSLFNKALLVTGTVPAGALPRFFAYMPVVEKVTLIFLVVAVLSSAFTFITGVMDWMRRYGKRPYRVISLKIILSTLFLILGLAAVGLHVSGLVFPAAGLAPLTPATLIFPLAYLGLLFANMFILATLGHVGGYLVFGK